MTACFYAVYKRFADMDMSQWMCHNGCVTMDVSQWMCHNGCVTMDVSHWMCHNGCVTISEYHAICTGPYSVRNAALRESFTVTIYMWPI